MNKIVVGTVQFGLDYGVSNDEGRISINEAENILSLAKKSGIDTLDTAVVYGESEKVLGEIGVDEWNIISKLPSLPGNYEINIRSWVREQIEGSLTRLKQSSIKGLLLHYPAQLLTQQGDELYRCLQDFKSEGLINQIGLSIYNSSELDNLFENMDFDVVQAPFNVLDNRLESSGWMRRLSDLRIEQHVRSIFLQGLLLMSPHQRPDYFLPWKDLLNKWDGWLEQNDVAPVQACMRHVLSCRHIDRVIVGVQSKSQLQDILSAVNADIPLIGEYLRSDDVDLLNPSNWKI